MKTFKLIQFLLLIIPFVNVNGAQIDSIIPVSNATYSAMGAFFSSGNENAIILNWTEEIDSMKTNVLKYRVFDSKTSRFSKEFVIPSSKGMQSHHESMPKIAKTESGVIYAIFRFATSNPKSRFAGSIYYAISNDDGASWSQKIKLVKDINAVSQSFYDIVLLPDGELGLTWLDSRKVNKDKGGSTLYFAKTNQGKGFESQKSIASYTCQCCRTDIYVDNDKKIHIAFRNIAGESIRDMYQVESIDNGFSFTQSKRLGEDNWKIEGCPHTGPSLGSNSEEVSVTWYTGAESGSGIFHKKLSGEVLFLEDKQLISESGKHPQMVSAENGDVHIVYEDYYTVEDISYSSIVLHTTEANGTKYKEEISVSKTNNSHAVLTKLDEFTIIVAWTISDQNLSNVVCKIIYL